MATRRRHQSREWKFVEVVAMSGAAVGVLIEVSQAAHDHTASRPCAARQAANCLGRTLEKDLMPYVIWGLSGLLIAGTLALLAVVAWLHLRRRFAMGNPGPRGVMALALAPFSAVEVG
jgi:hypothetical protein